MCEMCGQSVPRGRTVAVEGSLLTVCEHCAKFGKEVVPRQATPAARRGSGVDPNIAARLDARRRRLTPRDVYDQAGEEDLLLGFGEIIRRAREAKGWKREDLGKAINERVSIIEKLEKEGMRPNDKLIPRLERALGIRLRGKVHGTPVKRSGEARPLTLGDLVRLDE